MYTRVRNTAIYLIVIIIVTLCWDNTLGVVVADRQDPFFERFPLHPLTKGVFDVSLTRSEIFQSVSKLIDEMNDAHKGDQSLSQAPVVFHAYHSDARVIVGTARMEYVKNLIQSASKYKPVALGQSDRTPVSVWLVDHKDSSVGAYQEAQIQFYVSPSDLPYTLAVPYDEGDRASILYPFFKRLEEHSRLFIWKSIIVTRKQNSDLKSYLQSEVLGISHDMIQSETSPIVDQGNGTFFSFEDEYGDEILAGSLGKRGDDSWSSWWSTGKKIFKSLGLAAIFDLRYAKDLHFKTVSATSQKLIDTYATMKKCQFRDFDIDKGDSLVFGDASPLGKDMIEMQFQPEFVVKMPNYMQAIAAPRVSEDKEHIQAKSLVFEKVVDNKDPSIVIEDSTTKKNK